MPAESESEQKVPRLNVTGCVGVGALTDWLRLPSSWLLRSLTGPTPALYCVLKPRLEQVDVLRDRRAPSQKVFRRDVSSCYAGGQMWFSKGFSITAAEIRSIIGQSRAGNHFGGRNLFCLWQLLHTFVNWIEPTTRGNRNILNHWRVNVWLSHPLDVHRVTPAGCHILQPLLYFKTFDIRLVTKAYFKLDEGFFPAF